MTITAQRVCQLPDRDLLLIVLKIRKLSNDGTHYQLWGIRLEKNTFLPKQNDHLVSKAVILQFIAVLYEAATVKILRK